MRHNYLDSIYLHVIGKKNDTQRHDRKECSAPHGTALAYQTDDARGAFLYICSTNKPPS